MQAIDEYIPDPVRALDRPFSLPVEDVFSIQGRGTVVTGRIEQGIVKVGEQIEIIGIQPPTKTTVTGVLLIPSASSSAKKCSGVLHLQGPRCSGALHVLLCYCYDSQLLQQATRVAGMQLQRLLI